MSVQTVMSHRRFYKGLALFMSVLILFACAFVPSADAVAEVIGLPLISAILSAFGVTSVATGTVDGMLDGLNDLMGEFSESLNYSREWFRSLFDADTYLASYGRLGIGGTLIDTIKLFIYWLRSEHGLSSDNPIKFGESETTKISGVVVPVVSSTSILRGSSTLTAENFNPNSGSTITFTLPYDGNPYYWEPYHIDGKNFGLVFSTGVASYYGNIVQLPGGSVGRNGQLGVPLRPTQSQTFHYGFLISGSYYAFVSWHSSYTGNALISSQWYRADITTTVDSGWQINDDNLDLDYLDNDDDSTKDVVFAPSFPDVRNPDLSTLDKWNDAAREQLDRSKADTGTGEATGEITTTVDLGPGSGGPGNVPPIIIPFGGWFTSIWHYVVQALQDSAQGVMFIMQLVREFIPPPLLNLCWASAVLCITFGIVNKFLK